MRRRGDAPTLDAGVGTGLWENDVRPALQTLEAEGMVRLIESTPPYASMPGDKRTIASVAVVVQKQV